LASKSRKTSLLLTDLPRLSPADCP
jgi:hypothetical protein